MLILFQVSAAISFGMLVLILMPKAWSDSLMKRLGYRKIMSPIHKNCYSCQCRICVSDCKLKLDVDSYGVCHYCEDLLDSYDSLSEATLEMIGGQCKGYKGGDSN